MYIKTKSQKVPKQFPLKKEIFGSFLVNYLYFFAHKSVDGGGGGRVVKYTVYLRAIAYVGDENNFNIGRKN
jgi:hypothetical protein